MPQTDVLGHALAWVAGLGVGLLLLMALYSGVVEQRTRGDAKRR